ncbi:hypothetical protein TNCV_1109701 [Trichonephila clavipes]|nr:hypothetical protein TNCV_1109701 [Trichonephila clavipes]
MGQEWATQKRSVGGPHVASRPQFSINGRDQENLFVEHRCHKDWKLSGLQHLEKLEVARTREGLPIPALEELMHVKSVEAQSYHVPMEWSD